MPKGTDATADPPPGLGQWDSYLLYKAGWWLEREVEAALEPLGMRGRHLKVLMTLAESGTFAQQEMSSVLSIDPTLLIGVLDDLEDWGHAERRRLRSDRRRHEVVLSTKGRAALATAREAVAAAEERFYATLEPGEREALAGMCRRLVAPYWGERARGG